MAREDRHLKQRGGKIKMFMTDTVHLAQLKEARGCLKTSAIFARYPILAFRARS